MQSCINPLSNRDDDELQNVKMWLRIFWPITLVASAILFLAWIVTVIAIYAMILVLLLPATLVALLKRLRNPKDDEGEGSEAEA